MIEIVGVSRKGCERVVSVSKEDDVRVSLWIHTPNNNNGWEIIVNKEELINILRKVGEDHNL